jgi:hypothetical protein
MFYRLDNFIHLNSSIVFFTFYALFFSHFTLI